MKRTLHIFSALLCIVAVTVSIAAGSSANVSWFAPVAYNDGSNLPASDIDHYTITWSPATAQAGPSGSVNIPAGTLTTMVNVPCGSTTFNVTVTTSSIAKYPNVTSGPSAAVPYASGITCTPNPPSGLAVH